MNNPSRSNGRFMPTRQPLSRRRILQGAGVALALPMLDAMRPAFAKQPTHDTKPRRMLAICNNLGLLPELFFPKQTGRDYQLSPYLKVLEKHRNDFTVFSGVSHPDVDGGHPADNCFLTAAPHPASGRFKNTISLDQLMAEQIGHQTRFPSFTLGVNVQEGVRSLSWTESGVMIPCDQSASELFQRMFVQGTARETQEQVRKLELGQSILDTVAGQAKSLEKSLGNNDKQRLEQYFHSVRDLEKRIEASKAWESRPKPKVERPVPLDPANPSDYMEKVRLMYEISRLAFQTDSTRVITLMLDSVNSPAIDVDGSTMSDGYHNLSHHGRSEQKLKQLEVIDRWHMQLLAELFEGLKSFQEDDESLLDRSMVVYGSNLGNAHAHTCLNLPTLIAGGGFQHGQHLAFDTQRNYPLPNLFVSMLQRMNIEAEHFASSTGTMRGLDFEG
ncbi:MAG: DUF1552 domain-containing protein [Planctomycetota bacterium]